MAKMQFGNKIYDTDNPQDNAELLRLQNIARQNKINAQRKRLAAKIQPNSNLMPEIQAKAAAELANLNGLQTARQFEGRNPVARNVEDIVLNRMPPKIDNTPAGLLGITTPNVGMDVNSLLPAQSQPAQPQPKRTLGQRASGLFDRVSDAYMGAAPILAVAQEFQKAGALRPIGTPMQGDPYGKIMEIRQSRQQAENLAQLRQQYPQFANLSDKNFEQVITNLASDGKLNRPQLQPDLTPESYQQQFPEVYAGDMVADQAYGAKDRFDAGVSAVTGALGLPLKTTEKALAATVTYNKEVMEAQKTKYQTRDSVYQMKSVEELLPKPKMNEYKALQQTLQLRDIFAKAKLDLQAELARGGLTASQEGNIREGIRKFDNVIIRSNNRIQSLEQAGGVPMDTTSSTPNWEKSIQEAKSTFKILEDVRGS